MFAKYLAKNFHKKELYFNFLLMGSHVQILMLAHMFPAKYGNFVNFQYYKFTFKKRLFKVVDAPGVQRHFSLALSIMYDFCIGKELHTMDCRRFCYKRRSNPYFTSFYSNSLQLIQCFWTYSFVQIKDSSFKMEICNFIRVKRFFSTLQIFAYHKRLFGLVFFDLFGYEHFAKKISQKQRCSLTNREMIKKKNVNGKMICNIEYLQLVAHSLYAGS